MDITLTEKEVSESWKKVRANKGSPGIDGVSVTDFETNILHNLTLVRREWSEGQFQCQPYKTVVLRKNKKKRVISIPTVSDRIIHTALAAKLTQLFEPEFEAISYGYRPNRSYVDAIRKIEQLRDEGYKTVIDADIKGYFDHIPHTSLINTLKKYLPDQWVATLMYVLVHHQMDGDKCCFGMGEGLGIPQGSALSPLMANLYLDSFDEELLDRGEQIIRYADDFVVLLKDENRANTSLQFITGYLTHLGLSLNEEKTRVVTFNEGFTFLGVSFVDSIVIPLKTHTEKALIAAGKYSLEMDNEEIDEQRSAEDEELNISLWHSQLPASLKTLQAEIYDDDSGIPIEPDDSRLTRLSLNQIARLKLTYIHKQGSVVHKKGNRFTVWFDGKLLANIPASTLDMILCFGHVHLTQAVIQHCLTENITLVWLSRSGQFLGCLQSPFSGHPQLTHAQVATRNNSDQRTQLARFFIKCKINNCLGVVRRLGRKQGRCKQTEKQLAELREKLIQQQQIASMRGTEGAAARCYFQWYKKLFNPEWQFTNRNRQPPRDPINTLLSFGYTLLFYNVDALVQSRGLLPHLGFLHGDQPRQPALTLDLMESYRPWVVDELVWSVIQKGILTPEDFTFTKQACWLFIPKLPQDARFSENYLASRLGNGLSI